MESILDRVAQTCRELDGLTAHGASTDTVTDTADGTTADTQTADSTAAEIDGYAEMGVTDNG